jgi:hypothetical protein
LPFYYPILKYATNKLLLELLEELLELEEQELELLEELLLELQEELQELEEQLLLLEEAFSVFNVSLEVISVIKVFMYVFIAEAFNVLEPKVIELGEYVTEPVLYNHTLDLV